MLCRCGKGQTQACLALLKVLSKDIHVFCNLTEWRLTVVMQDPYFVCELYDNVHKTLKMFAIMYVQISSPMSNTLNKHHWYNLGKSASLSTSEALTSPCHKSAVPFSHGSKTKMYTLHFFKKHSALSLMLTRGGKVFFIQQTAKE